MQRLASVLDHGFVELRNVSGPTRRDYLVRVSTDRNVPPEIPFFDANDSDPANAARMSFDLTDSEVVVEKDGTVRPRTAEDDRRLCKYLMKNWHTSPFEQIQVWLEMKLPIFVARQFVRHRTVRLNEVSGRYIQLPQEWYIPEVVGGKAKSAKQGQEDNLDETQQANFRSNLDKHCRQGYELYSQAIAEGVAPEHARLHLSLNHYTHWLWNQDIHNLMHFLSLRDHSHAQVEAQAYAKAIDFLLRQVLPGTMQLYDEFRRKA